jgi:Helicase HerA, central domain/Type IV secretion-system coupling protein DNA-binding domain
MSEIEKRAMTRRAMVQGSLCAMYPTLLRKLPSAPAVDRTAIVLGRNQQGGSVFLPVRPRMEHMHVIGTTGGGKSKFLEHCIRQDIANGCGVLVVDPHGEHPGSLYRSLIIWLVEKGYAARRSIHLIDPNAPSHIVGFNPLDRPDPEMDISVVAGVTLESFSRAWGDEDSTSKPTMERVLMAMFAALAELNLTLVEAPFLLDRKDRHGLRAFAIDNVKDRYTRDELQRLHELSLDDRRRHDFDLEVVAPVNRIARFLRPSSIRGMIGQTERLIDFRAAMDNGHIILANVSGGARVYERDCDLLGRLLTRTLFFHAKRRRATDRPFFVYLDECHRYLSGDVENILAESRKYGIGTVLSHQWLQQLAVDGDDKLLAAVRNATNTKIVFRIKDPVEAEELAHAVIPLDLEIPVRSLIKPTVVGHRRIRLASEGTSEQTAKTSAVTESEGSSESQSVSYAESEGVTDGESKSFSESETASAMDATARSDMSAVGESVMATDMLNPNQTVFGAPIIIGMSEGTGQTAQTASGTSSSSGHGRSAGSARAIGSMHATTRSSTWGESTSHGTSRATSVGRAETRGTGRTQGTSEALEPILSEMPSAVHGKENVLYMAAQTLRTLPTGQAVINYVGQSGMVSVMLTVPRISEHPLSAGAFASLRERVLSRSSAATPIEQAILLVSNREQKLLDARRKAQEIPEPETFRTAAPPSAVARERSRPAAASPGRARKVSNEKRHVR